MNQWVGDLNYILSVSTEMQDRKDIFQMQINGVKAQEIPYYKKYFAKNYNPDYREETTVEELEKEAERNLQLLEKRRHVRKRQDGRS